MSLTPNLHKLEGKSTNSVPLISVVICTHNRANYLLKAIRSVLDQTYPKNQYEIIVVDNASTDSTADKVRPFSEAGYLRYVHEPELGISFARNTGWRVAAGRYIAYLDDDAIAAPGWLSAIEKAFQLTPNAGAVGGRVDPIWEAKRPEWLEDDLVMSLGVIDWADKPKIIPDLRMEWLVTANMAVPAAVLAEIGGFETRLGRVGKTQVRGEDTFFQKQVIRRGYPCYYYPDMVVGHHVPASRLNKPWFRKRYYTQGIADALTQLVEEEPSGARRVSMALSMIFDLILSPGNILNIVLPAMNPGRFTKKCLALITLGHITGLLTARRQ
jgi:glycosyltransferase involved in cell wall biosynthesis